MGISRYYTKQISTKRLADVSGSYKEEYQTNLTGVACSILPLDDAKSLVNDTGFAKNFKFFCDPSYDIVAGDLIIDGSDTYTVKGVINNNYGTRSVSHKALIIVKGE